MGWMSKNEACVPIAPAQPPKGCIHHVDRGSQYCSHDYPKLRRQHAFKTSMSRKGNCCDDTAVETSLKTIRTELLWQRSWQTRRHTEAVNFQDINGFYYPRRQHSALGWISPVAPERKAAQNEHLGRRKSGARPPVSANSRGGRAPGSAVLAR